MKVLILMGLPGSGKTTYAQEVTRLNKPRVGHIDLDSLLLRFKAKALGRLSRLKDLGGYRTGTYVIDGLIHMNEQVLGVLSEVTKNEELTKVEVHYWRENREQCLINDRGRREVSSQTSIKNLPLEVPDLDSLRAVFPSTTIHYHEVPTKPQWLILADTYGLGCSLSNPYFKSDSWSTGGSYGNCWDDSIRYYEAETPLTNFEEFDKLITTIKSDITLTAYKELYGKCVSIGTACEHDYYGGSGSHSAFYQCDVRALYEGLVSMGVIEGEGGI